MAESARTYHTDFHATRWMVALASLFAIAISQCKMPGVPSLAHVLARAMNTANCEKCGAVLSDSDARRRKPGESLRCPKCRTAKPDSAAIAISPHDMPTADFPAIAKASSAPGNQKPGENLNFYFCEKCGKRLSNRDIEAGRASDKKLRGVFCSACAVGVNTIEFSAAHEHRVKTPAAEHPRPAGTPKTPSTPLAQKATPPRRLLKPRVGFLHWLPAKNLRNEYCTDLFEYFVQRAERGEIELEALGEFSNKPYPPIAQVKAGRFDAILSNGIWHADYIAQLKALNVPFVSCDHEPVDHSVDAVTFDNEKGGEEAGKLLLAQGHTDVLFITNLRRDLGAVAGADPWIEDAEVVQRRRGVLHALLGSRAEFWPLVYWVDNEGYWVDNKNTDIPGKTGKQLERIIADAGHAPTAIVAHNMNVAMASRELLTSMNLKIPDDVSILTFHAPAPKARSVEDRAFSHMHFSWTEMAAHAWKILSSRLNGMGISSTPQRVKLLPNYTDCGTLGPRRAGH